VSEERRLVWAIRTEAHERWLRFVELSPFSRRRGELRLTDEDIRALQIAILANPGNAPVIPGTGGIRKMRFARPSDNRGKSGSYRVLYVFFPLFGLVVLVTAYGKSEQADIDAADRRLFKQMVARIEKELHHGQSGA
jgi:hypothetical protein